MQDIGVRLLSRLRRETAKQLCMNSSTKQRVSLSLLRRRHGPSIKMEMNCFVQTGVRGKMLSFIDAAIKTVRPSSIEPERTFSTAGWTQTKVRNRMGPRILDSISSFKIPLKKS